MPLGASVCDFCGHVFTRERGEKGVLTAFEMTEIDLLDRSPFAWCDLHGDGHALMASGFHGWAGVFSDGALWHALGQPRQRRSGRSPSAPGCRRWPPPTTSCAQTETGTASAKSRRWLNDPATLRQIELLQRAGHAATGLDFGLSKYAANCHLNFRWNRGAITAAVLGHAERSAA